VLPIDELEVREYLTAHGVSPFGLWLGTLDVSVRARIDQAIRRFADGNFGDYKGVGEGVLETRINTGPGYRIYYGLDGAALVILLAGGTKRGQDRDIAKAAERWRDYKERKRRAEIERCH
jgi:putative addiction module killer protein